MSSPAGLRLLVPGASQWSWGQRERGLALFLSYWATAALGVFAWGTVTGLVLLAVSFGIHTASAVDAVRQSAFPGQGRWASWLGVSLGLAVLLYGPLLAIASVVAWPGMRGGATLEGYLVNRWAYRRAEPRRHDWVWYRPNFSGEPRLGRVVAGQDQAVEWSGERLRVDGQLDASAAPAHLGYLPFAVAYRVPKGHVLVRPDAAFSASRAGSRGMEIVARYRIVGQVWARLYPIRERRFLD